MHWWGKIGPCSSAQLAVLSDQEGVFTILSVFGRDMLQHVDVKRRVQRDVGDKLQGLVLIRRFLYFIGWIIEDLLLIKDIHLQFCGLFSVRSVTEKYEKDGRDKGHQSKDRYGCGDPQHSVKYKSGLGKNNREVSTNLK